MKADLPFHPLPGLPLPCLPALPLPFRDLLPRERNAVGELLCELPDGNDPCTGYPPGLRWMSACCLRSASATSENEDILYPVTVMIIFFSISEIPACCSNCSASTRSEIIVSGFIMVNALYHLSLRVMREVMFSPG